MKNRLPVLAVLGCALCSAAQESPAPASSPESKPANKESASSTSASVQSASGKILLETEINGKKETRALDLRDPANAASLEGKVVITTDINGKKETRIVDLKDAGNILGPFPFDERPPARTGMVAYLGVATVELPREVSAQVPLPQETGLLIGAVAPDSPAAKAGLMESDVLSKLDDQILITPRQLAVLIANHREGDTIKLTYYRKGQAAETSAVLGKHEAPPPVSAVSPLARITRHMLKAGPDGKIIPDSASPLSLPMDLKMTQEDLKRILGQCPADIRPALEKALRPPKPQAAPGEAKPSDPPSPARQ